MTGRAGRLRPGCLRRARETGVRNEKCEADSCLFEADNLPVFKVYGLGEWFPWQTWHSDDIPGEYDQKPRAGIDKNFLNRYFEVLWTAS